MSDLSRWANSGHFERAAEASYEAFGNGHVVAQGGIDIRTLALRGPSPLEGGIPLIVDNKVVGAIGVSGATSVQDCQVANAGADAAK